MPLGGCSSLGYWGTTPGAIIDPNALAPSTSVNVPAQVRKYALRCSNDRQACRNFFRECRHDPTVASSLRATQRHFLIET